MFLCQTGKQYKRKYAAADQACDDVYAEQVEDQKEQEHRTIRYFFFDYMYYILLDQMSDNDLFPSARHPILDILLTHDAEKGSDLYNTLNVYSQTGFNKIKTSERLYLHRNSVFSAIFVFDRRLHQ